MGQNRNYIKGIRSKVGHDKIILSSGLEDFLILVILFIEIDISAFRTNESELFFEK